MNKLLALHEVLAMKSQSIKNRIMFKFCCLVAGMHFFIFLSCVFIASLYDGFDSIIVLMAVWSFIDLPISLLYIVISNPLYSLQLKIPVLEWVFYPPYFIHGVLGTIWWFYLPKIYYAVKARFRKN